jgi:hypothetical protein
VNRRAATPAALVLLALFAALYGRFLIGWTPVGGDIVNQYLPYQELIRNAVRAGDAPLWNSFTFLGRPLMADIQVGVLYPPNWLHWVLPLPVSFGLVLALHGAWMLLGCWRLGRAWRFEPAAIAMGTVVFAASPFFTLKLFTGVILFTYVGAWWPWLALAATRLARRPGWGSMGLLAGALAMSLLAGSPQLTYYGWLATLAVGLAVPPMPGSPGVEAAEKRWMRQAGWLAGGFALALGLTAVQTFQTYHFISTSFERGSGADWNYITESSLDPRLLWLLVNPGMLGNGATDRAHYWGGMADYGESCFHAPLWIVCILLPMGCAALCCRSAEDQGAKSEEENGNRVLHRRLAWLGAIAMGLGLLLAMGRHSYAFRFFFEFFPAFDKFRVPMRLMVFWSAGLGLLAALAAQALLTASSLPWRRLRIAAAGGFAVGAFLVLGPWIWRRAIWSELGSPFLDHPEYGPAAHSHLLAMTLRGGGAMLIAGGLALGLARPAARRARWIGALAVLAAVELVALAWPFQTVARWSAMREQFYPQTPVIDALKEQHRDGAILWMDDTLSYLTDQNQPEVLTNRLVMFGLPQARGYDPVNARWIGEWFNRLAGFEPGRNPGGFMFAPRIALPAWLTLMGVETIVSYADLSGLPGWSPGARFAFPPDPQVPGAPAMTLTLWRNERFAGRAFAAPPATFADDWRGAMGISADRAATIAGDLAAGPAQALVYDLSGFARDPDALAGQLSLWPGAVDARFRVEPLGGDTNRFRYHVDYPTPAFLCLAQSAYDGWRATIDGQPTRLHSNYCGAFVVAAIPAGSHEVAFQYVPKGLGPGATVSFASLMLLAIGAIRGRQRAASSRVR